ncbi:MAG: hypothetical protein R2748_28375 [Bryobacterales bacterium]
MATYMVAARGRRLCRFRHPSGNLHYVNRRQGVVIAQQAAREAATSAADRALQAAMERAVVAQQQAKP